MFIAAFFTISKIWRQPKCPSTDEWTKKAQFVYTMEYYSAMKKNGIMPFAATLIQLEIVILSEVRKTNPIDITYMWDLKYDTNGPIYESEADSQVSRTCGCLGRGRGGEDW